MTARKRALWAAIILLAACFVVQPLFFKKKDEPQGPPPLRPVRTMVLRPLEGLVARTTPGRVQASRRVDLAFRVSGPLVDIRAKEGDLVLAGDVLARIDPRDFRLALEGVRGSLSQAAATLEAMKKGARVEDIRGLEAKAASASARAKEAEAQYKRFLGLYESASISQAEFDRYKTAKDVAASALAGALQELAKARRGARDEDIKAMESQIRSLEAREAAAAAALADTELRAPFDGMVARRMVENYQFVSAMQPVISLQDPSSVEVVVDLPESMMNLDPKAVEIRASFGVLPGRSFPLRFVEYSSSPDPETQTYRATLAMDVPPGVRLLPGMAAEVYGSVKTASDQEVYRVPIQSLLSDGDGPGIWLVRDLKASWMPVETVLLGDGWVDVKGGINSGDILITAGVHSVKDGQGVRLLEDKK